MRRSLRLAFRFYLLKRSLECKKFFSDAFYFGQLSLQGSQGGCRSWSQELYFLLDKCVYENDYVQLTICGKVG